MWMSENWVQFSGVCPLPCVGKLSETFTQRWNPTTMNTKSPSGLFGGHGILLNRGWFNVCKLRNPSGNSEVFTTRSATGIRQCVPSLGHVCRLTQYVLSFPLLLLPHSCVILPYLGTKPWRVRGRFHDLWRSITWAKALSLPCLWHAYQLSQLIWNNTMSNLWVMDTKTKLNFLAVTQIAHSK